MKRHSKFQTNMQRNFNSIRLSDFKESLTDLPSKFRDFFNSKLNKSISAKKNKNPIDEVYDDSLYSYGPNYNGLGSISCASSISKSSAHPNEPVVYNSGTESDYNASILSESCSVAPPPPPPPPPVPYKSYENNKAKKTQRRSFDIEEENSNDDDLETNEQANGRHFKRSESSAKVSYNKYTNKLKYQRHHDNTRIWFFLISPQF